MNPKEFNAKWEKEYGKSVFNRVLKGKVPLPNDIDAYNFNTYNDMLMDLSRIIGISDTIDKVDGWIKNREKVAQQLQDEFYEHRNNTVVDSSKFENLLYTRSQFDDFRFKTETVLEAFVDQFQNPYHFNSTRSTSGIFAPTFKTPDVKGIPVINLNRDVYDLKGVFGSSKTSRRINQQFYLDQDTINQVANSKVFGKHEGPIQFQGGTIWSRLTSPVLADAYSPYSVNVQGQIETFTDFFDQFKNGKGFISWDIETLGNKDTGEGFGVTELSARRIMFDKSTGTHAIDSNNDYNLVIKPLQSTQNYYQSLIKSAQQNPAVIAGWDDDIKRSLVDLMKYSSSKETGQIQLNKPIEVAQFKTAEGVIHNTIVQGLEKSGQLKAGQFKDSYNADFLMKNFNTLSQHMLSGLGNMSSKGDVTPTDLFGLFNNLSKNTGEYFVSHNGLAFDAKGMELFADIVTKQTGVSTQFNAPTRHLDLLKVIQSVFDDGGHMHREIISNLGLDEKKGRKFIDGPFTLQEFRRTFGWDTETAHAAGYDTGLKGLGGVLANVSNFIMEEIERSTVNPMYSPKGPMRKRGSFLHSDRDPVLRGQEFYSPNAVQKRNNQYADFQSEWNENGTLNILNNDINNRVLDADSFYRVNGIRKLDANKYGLELINDETGTSTHIIREGEDARHQIAKFVQEHLLTIDDVYQEAEKDAVIGERLRDQARRGYDNLHSLKQGYTSGFDAAERMYTNAKIFAEQGYGFDENGKLPSLADSEIKRLEGLMDFDSLWSKSGTPTFNPYEAKKFWGMLPRLLSEHEVYLDAIQGIKEAIPESEGANRRELGTNRSAALKAFTQKLEMDESVGIHESRRILLPHEQLNLKFQDPGSNRTRSINLSNARLAYGDIMSYIYTMDESLKADPDKKEITARQRLKTLSVALHDEGFLDQNRKDRLLYHLDQTNLSAAESSRRLTSEITQSLQLLDEVRRRNNFGVIGVSSMDRREKIESVARDLVHGYTQTAVNTVNDIFRSVSGAIDLSQLSIGNTLQELDTLNPVTRLQPNNFGSVQKVLNSFANQGVSVTVGLNGDQTSAIFHVMKDVHKDTVVSQLMNGETNTPYATVIEMPLVNNGTIQLGNRTLNAHSIMVMRNGKPTMVSSGEKIADDIANKAGEISYQVVNDNQDFGSYLARSSINESVKSLSGDKYLIGGGNSDTFEKRGNLSDVAKQSQIDIYPAMIRNYLQRGALKESDLNESAYEYVNRSLQLKEYLSIDDVGLDAREKLIRERMGWVDQQIREGNLTENDRMHFALVKSDHYDDYLTGLNGRELIPGEHLNHHLRDNLAQLLNADPISTEIQENLIKNNVPVSFDKYTTTEMLEGVIDSKFKPGERPWMHGNVLYLKPGELVNRFRTMAESEEGFNLLNNRGIITGERDDWKFVADALPTTHEQQMIALDSFAKELKMTQVKEFHINESFEPNGEDFKVGSVIPTYRKGDKGASQLGVQLQDGTLSRVLNETGHDLTVLDIRDNKIITSFQEDAHKLISGIEKGTIGKRFDAELMQAVTGRDDVVLIQESDVTKHNDPNSLIGGQQNRIIDQLNQMDQTTAQPIIDQINNSTLGLTVAGSEGSYYLNQSAYDDSGTVRNYDTGKLKDILDAVGLNEVDVIESSPYGFEGYEQTVLKQRIAVANVHDYSEASEEGKVKYGARELKMLRAQGAHAEADHIFNMMIENAKESGAYQEFLGMDQALHSLGGNLDAAGFVEGETKVYNFSDFAPLPTQDVNIADNYKGTIFDKDALKRVTGYDPNTSTNHGVWFSLPTELHEGSKIGIEIEGRVQDKVFLPYSQLQGEVRNGNTLHKNLIQGMIADIYTRGRAVEEAVREGKYVNKNTNAVDPSLIRSMQQGVQGKLTSFGNQLNKEITSSKGFFHTKVLSLRMPNSAAGIAKIQAPELLEQSTDAITYIHRDDAKSMGILDKLENLESQGLDYFVEDNRYPTFHRNAGLVTKVQLSDQIQPGQQLTQSIIADYLRQDADGDYNNIVGFNDDKMQKELAQKYEDQYVRQMKEIRVKEGDQNLTLHEQKLGQIEALGGTEQDLRSQARDFISQHYLSKQNDESDRMNAAYRYNMNAYANEHGIISGRDEVSMMDVRFKEHTSRYGKELVGMASNLNFKMEQVATQALESNIINRDQWNSILNLGEGRKGIEQKIISAKHGDDIAVNFEQLFKEESAAKRFITAMQKGSWSEAVQIDKNLLGGEFSKNAGLEEAANAMQVIWNHMDDNQKYHFGYKIGTSSGASGKRFDEVSSALLGQEYMPNTNASFNFYTEAKGSNVPTGAQIENIELPPQQEANVHIPDNRVFSERENRPATARLAQDLSNAVPEPQTNYAERGYMSQIGSVIGDALRGKMGVGLGIAAGVGAAGLMLTNMTSGDNLTPEDRPYNSEEMQEHHLPYPQMQQTARLEESGYGLNKGMRVSVRGSVANGLANEDVGNMAGQALNQAGINANINVRSQDDRSSVDEEWLQEQFTQLINSGYVGG